MHINIVRNKMEHLIPEDVLRHIASFLPYNERVEMNRALPFHYRLVKKLNSDEHNAKYKQELLQKKLARFEESPAGSLARLNQVKQMMLYLLHTKDTCLLRNCKFRNTVITKCREFSNVGNYGNLLITERAAVRSCMRAASQLLSKLESTTFPNHKKITPQFVQIM